jgi:hypothetical protein
VIYQYYLGITLPLPGGVYKKCTTNSHTAAAVVVVVDPSNSVVGIPIYCYTTYFT